MSNILGGYHFGWNIYTVRNLAQRFTKIWYKLGQKVASIKWWNIKPTFGTRFHHVSTIEIRFSMVWWNLEPNIGRRLHHFTEVTFWSSFLPYFGEMLNKISNSVHQTNTTYFRWWRIRNKKKKLEIFFWMFFNSLNLETV